MISLSSYPVLRTYALFKFEFKIEKYLVCIKHFQLRKLLTKFRLSSHNLEIEAGRHSKPKVPLEMRVCKHCSSDEVESEIHVLMLCKKYDLLREEFYTILEKIDPSIVNDNYIISFINIMSSQNEQVLFSLCKFLCKVFKLRK